MPQSVLEGRIIKRNQKHVSRTCTQASKQLVSQYKSNNGEKAKPKDLEKYRDAIKFYYFTRRYPRPLLYEAMELIFKVGASPKQYEGYADKNLRKKLSKEEWRQVAKYRIKNPSNFREIAIRIDGGYIIQPAAVKKELSRQISATEESLMKNELSKNPAIEESLSKNELSKKSATEESQIEKEKVPLPRSVTIGSLELFDPTICATREEIPASILASLPILKSQGSLLKICQGQLQNTTGGKEIGRVANSNYFRYLKVLLYRLSNDLIEPIMLDELLDKVMELGFRSSLKEILSLKTISTKFAAENLILFLILRNDLDLINHIFRIHDVFPVNCFDAIYDLMTPFDHRVRILQDEILKNIRMHDLLKKYNGARDVCKSLLNQIEQRQIYPSNPSEAAFLVACATKWDLISITKMEKLMPKDLKRDQVDEFYEYYFQFSILRSRSKISLQDFLSHGFRRNLHMATLEAILLNDSERAFDLIPYANLGIELSTETSGKLDNNSYPSPANMFKIIGMEGFSRLVLAAVHEHLRTYMRSMISPYCARGFIILENEQMQLLSCCIFIAQQQKDWDLFTFLLSFIQTRISRRRQVAVLSAALQDILCKNFSSSLEHRNSCCFKRIDTRALEQTNDHDGEDQEKRDWPDANVYIWCKKLINSGADINSSYPFGTYSGHLDTTDSNILCKALSHKKFPIYVELAEAALKLGADPNHELESGSTPVKILLSKAYERATEKHNYKMEFRRILPSLIRAGAVFSVDCSLGNASYWTLEDIEVFNSGNLGRIYRMLDDLFPRVPRTCEFCEAAARAFDFAFCEAGGWRESTLQQKLKEYHQKNLDRLTSPISCRLPPIESTALGFQVIWFLLELSDEAEELQEFISCHANEAKKWISMRDSNDLSLLHLAAKNQRIKSLHILLQNGSDPNEIVSRGVYLSFSALHWAVEKGNLDIAKHLLKYGAEIFELPKANNYCLKHQPGIAPTPVHLAVRLRRLDFVALFLLHDINCRPTVLEACKTYNVPNIERWVRDEWMSKEPGVQPSSNEDPRFIEIFDSNEGPGTIEEIDSNEILKNVEDTDSDESLGSVEDTDSNADLGIFGEIDSNEGPVMMDPNGGSGLFEETDLEEGLEIVEDTDSDEDSEVVDSNEGLGTIRMMDWNQGLGTIEAMDWNQDLETIEVMNWNQGLGTIGITDWNQGLGTIGITDWNQGLETIGMANWNQGLETIEVMDWNQGLETIGMANWNQGLETIEVMDWNQGSGTIGVANWNQGLETIEVMDWNQGSGTIGVANWNQGLETIGITDWNQGLGTLEMTDWNEGS
ncbi:hypothetical protein TWF730_006420 [Orbilia blumenaviensis]|uniref:Clr5 domain-containing protein n=1 Tax=Orbilia blumenaviensis TaxID=1796055 RepID=A0AAV9VFR6_9PEZI